MTNGELIDFLSQFPREKTVEVNVGTFYYQDYDDVTPYNKIISVVTSSREPDKIFLEGDC